MNKYNQQKQDINIDINKKYLKNEYYLKNTLRKSIKRLIAKLK